MICQWIQTSIPRIHLTSFQSFKNPRVSQEKTTTVYSGGTLCNKWSTSSTRLCLFSRFSPVFTRGKFCWRCTWRFSCFSQYLSSRVKPSIFLKGVFEDRKCFEINNFFAGVDPDRPYKFQWLNFVLKFCAVCNVIAPRGSEELLQAFKTLAVNEVCTNDLTTLITAYKQASSKNLKTQILSIYAPRYSARFLKKFTSPLKNWAIDKLRRQGLMPKMSVLALTSTKCHTTESE